MSIVRPSFSGSPFTPSPSHQSTAPTRFGMAQAKEDNVTVSRRAEAITDPAIAMKLLMFKTVADLIAEGGMNPERVVESQMNIVVALLHDPKLLKAAQTLPELQNLPLVALILDDPEMAQSLVRFLEKNGLTPSDLPSLINLTNQLTQVLLDFHASRRK